MRSSAQLEDPEGIAADVDSVLGFMDGPLRGWSREAQTGHEGFKVGEWEGQLFELRLADSVA